MLEDAKSNEDSVDGKEEDKDVKYVYLVSPTLCLRINIEDNGLPEINQ